MITNIPFESLIYTLFLRGFLRVQHAIQTFRIPPESTIRINIPVSARFKAIPYYLRFIPHKDYVFEFKFFIDGKLLIHDDNVRLVNWQYGIDFLHQMKVILFAEKEFNVEVKSRSGYEEEFSINFIYGEVREDIKEKIFDTYFLMIDKQFEEEAKKIKVERLELRREGKGRVC